MGRSHRPERLAEEIRKIISEMLVRGDLKDPRFSGNMTGISGVDVTRDGSYASVYISCLSYSGKSVSEEEKKDIIAAFERSQGYIRSAIGKAVKVRYVPVLLFKFDESYEYGAKMDRLLDDIKKSDEQVDSDSTTDKQD